MPTFFLWPSQIALIQPIHGQGYNSDIPRPDAPVIYTGAFPILTAWLGRRSICNKFMHQFRLNSVNKQTQVYIK